MSKKTVTNQTPQADSVQWVGLCPCGCGTYKAVLVDEKDNCMATFGWDVDGWLHFMKGVANAIMTDDNEDAAKDAFGRMPTEGEA
jgi:hypothetical protein